MDNMMESVLVRWRSVTLVQVIALFNARWNVYMYKGLAPLPSQTLFSLFPEYESQVIVGAG